MKAFNYTMITLGVIIVLYLSGLLDQSNIAFFNILDSIGFNLNDGVDNGTSLFWVKSAALLTTVLAVGVAASFFAKGTVENSLLGGFASVVLFTFAQVWYAIGNYALDYKGWAGYLTIVLVTLFGVAFVFSLIEFYRGTD